MNLAWRATLVTVAGSAAAVLVACTAAPTPTGPGSAGSPGPSATVTVAGSTSPASTPSAAPGPTLTRAQFADLISTGKLGSREVTLKPASIKGAEDPDGEGEEGEQQSEATSCVKMYRLAATDLLAQASDDDQGAAIQLFAKPGSAAELFDLNRVCAAEEAGFSPSTATIGVADGTVGSALWWLSKDPDLNYQLTLCYGNVLAYTVVEADTDSEALTRAFAGQIDEAGQS